MNRRPRTTKRSYYCDDVAVDVDVDDDGGDDDDVVTSLASVFVFFLMFVLACCFLACPVAVFTIFALALDVVFLLLFLLLVLDIVPAAFTWL